MVDDSPDPTAKMLGIAFDGEIQVRTPVAHTSDLNRASTRYGSSLF